MKQHERKSSPLPGGVPGWRQAFVAGLVVFLVGAGTLATHAAWTASTAKSIAVTAATVATTSTGIPDLTTIYRRGLSGVTVDALTKTIPITVSNTGTAPLVYSLAVTGGTATLNARISLQIWRQVGSCTNTTIPDAGTVSAGTLSAPPALATSVAAIAAGATTVFCARTNLGGTFAESVGSSTAPTVTFRGTVGTYWSASTSATFTQSAALNWFALQKSPNGKCVDTRNNSTTVNTPIVLYTCATAATASSQAFRFEETDTGFFHIYVGAGTAAGPVLSGPGILQSAVILATPTNWNLPILFPLANRQQWFVVQNGTAGDFQIKNRETPGSCLTISADTDAAPATLATCSTSTVVTSAAYRSQHFRFNSIG